MMTHIQMTTINLVRTPAAKTTKVLMFLKQNKNPYPVETEITNA